MGEPAPRRRPLIAIPARFSTNASALRHRAEVASHNLIAGVYAAGGEPVVVHPHAPAGNVSDEEVAARLAWADGLLLPGGGDIAGHWSGQPEHPSLYDVDDEQDAFDIAAARAALARRLPLLSICRGTQVVNVTLGGTLVQDMDEHEDEAMSHHRNHVHHITVDPGTTLHAAVGDSVRASCYHHQCLDTLAPGLVVTARAEEGVIEAVELAAYDGWYLGVQWHPEDSWRTDPTQLGVFEALIAAC